MFLFPGSFLDSLSRVNPRAHEGLAVLGLWAVLLMVVVALCVPQRFRFVALRSLGLHHGACDSQCEPAGDAINAFVGHDWRTLIGLPIGGAMIIYLLSRRQVFG